MKQFKLIIALPAAMPAQEHKDIVNQHCTLPLEWMKKHPTPGKFSPNTIYSQTVNIEKPIK